MSEFKIIKKSVDYFKMVIYRVRKTGTIQSKNQHFCDIVYKFIQDFKLDIPESERIFNINGLGVNSGFTTKVLVDFRSEFFLRNGFSYIADFISWLETNNIKYRVTRLDLCCDYLNDQLLPFANKKNIFGKMSKGLILIPEKFRGDLVRPTEWVQMKSGYILSFYDKTKEILSNKNTEKTLLYPKLYTTSQVYRFEIKLLRFKEFKFIIDEGELIQNYLLKWYARNKFLGRDQNKINQIIYNIPNYK